MYNCRGSTEGHDDAHSTTNIGGAAHDQRHGVDGGALSGLDPVLKPMLALRANDLFWLFAAALLGHVAIAEWRASRPRARPQNLMPANDDQSVSDISQAA